MSGTDVDPRGARALNAILARQDGVITWQQARRHLSEKAVRHRVRSGRWRRTHRGIYLTHTGTMTDRQQLWTASLGAGNGRPALLAGVTALKVLGLGPLSLGPGRDLPLHILVHTGHPDRDPPPGVTVHRTRRLGDADVCPVVAPPCTTAARALVDAVEWAQDRAEAMRVLAAVHRHRLVSPAQIRPVLSRLPRLSRRGLIEATVFDGDSGGDAGSRAA